MQLTFDTSAIEQTHDLRCFKKLVDGSYNRGFETIRDLIGV